MRDALLDAQKPGSEPQLYRFLEPGEEVPEGAEYWSPVSGCWKTTGTVGKAIDAMCPNPYRVPVTTPILLDEVAELGRALAAERRAMDMLCQLNPDLYRDLECLRRLAKETAE